MSSGFFSFFAHAGVLFALQEAGLRPAHLGGSSAGALVAALWASGRDASEIRGELLRLERADFWDPAIGLGLLRGRLFREKMERDLGCERFEECRAKLSVVVHDVIGRAPRVIESGAIAEAVHASCAVPFLFRPVRHQRRWWIDGGVSDRAARTSFQPGVRTLHHHIASRSPWRRPGSPALEPPQRADLVALVLRDLPRVGPFKLGNGALALEQARAAAARSLHLPWAPVMDIGS